MLQMTIGIVVLLMLTVFDIVLETMHQKEQYKLKIRMLKATQGDNDSIRERAISAIKYGNKKVSGFKSLKKLDIREKLKSINENIYAIRCVYFINRVIKKMLKPIINKREESL